MRDALLVWEWEVLNIAMPWVLKRSSMQASAINILDTYHETVPLWDFHLKDKDCTHFCNPSGYELWTYLLKEKLFHLQPWLKTLDA